MKTATLKKIVQSLAACALLVGGSAVFAASTWNFSSNATPECSAQGTGSTNSEICGSNPVGGSVTVTGWSILSPGGAARAEVTQTAEGFGVHGPNDTSPLMDNSGSVDLIRLGFGVSTEIEQIGLGKKSVDSDISLYYYVGGAGSTTDITGLSVSDLSSHGWQLVSNYNDLTVTGAADLTSTEVNKVAPNIVNSGSLSSSWWLVSAYSGATASCGGTVSGNDAMRVLAIATAGGGTNPPSSNKVPEPGSLALMGAALTAFVASRRKQKTT
jgi:hypothetical protein